MDFADWDKLPGYQDWRRLYAANRHPRGAHRRHRHLGRDGEEALLHTHWDVPHERLHRGDR